MTVLNNQTQESTTTETTTAPVKTYMERILETPVEYPAHVIDVMKEFKKYHKLGTESDESRLDAMSILVREIASAYQVQAPIIRMDRIDGSSSADSCYSQNDHSITMRGKLSIITFLHEVAHAILSHNEHQARVWSLNLFKRIYPKSFAKLQGDGHFMTLNMTHDHVGRPVRTSSITSGSNNPGGGSESATMRDLLNRLLNRGEESPETRDAVDRFIRETSGGVNPYDQPASTIAAENTEASNEPAS